MKASAGKVVLRLLLMGAQWACIAFAGVVIGVVHGLPLRRYITPGEVAQYGLVGPPELLRAVQWAEPVAIATCVCALAAFALTISAVARASKPPMSTGSQANPLSSNMQP